MILIRTKNTKELEIKWNLVSYDFDYNFVCREMELFAKAQQNNRS